MEESSGNTRKVRSLSRHRRIHPARQRNHSHALRPIGTSCDTALKFVSMKNGLRSTICFTLTEVRACLFLEFIPQVGMYLRFESFPAVLGRYAPQFVATVRQDDGRERILVVKVLCKAELSRKPGKRLAAELKQACREHGYIPCVMTEKTLCRPLIANFHNLYFTRLRNRVSERVIEQVFVQLMDWEAQRKTFGHAFTYFQDKPNQKAALCDLLITGDAIAQLNRPLAGQRIRTPCSGFAD